jgi:hypothetical protein
MESFDNVGGIVAATVTTGVLQSSPLKKSHPDITKKERSSENKERSLNHSFDLNSMNVGVITFLILGSG